MGPRLERMEGFLNLGHGTVIKKLTLENLRFLQYGIDLKQSVSLQQVVFPELQRTGSSIGISDCDSLTTVSMPKLFDFEIYDVGFTFRNLPMLDTLDLSSVAKTKNPITISNVTALTAVKLSSLRSCSAFTAEHLPSLTILDLPNLTNVTQSFTLQMLAELRSVEMPQLSSDVRIRTVGTPKLANIDLPTDYNRSVCWNHPADPKTKPEALFGKSVNVKTMTGNCTEFIEVDVGSVGLNCLCARCGGVTQQKPVPNCNQKSANIYL